MVTDLEAVCLSAVIILGYWLVIRLRFRQNLLFFVPMINAHARDAWVENMMGGGPGKDILAVQTLRNSTMAATFFASTAILLVIGVLNLIPRNGDVPTAVFEVLYRHALAGDVGALKLLLLLGEYFWTFFCFSLAVRMYNHVSFLINSVNERYEFITQALVAGFLKRAGHYYSLGMHTYYLSLPVVFWLFGPVFLIIATIGAVALMFHADSAKVASKDAQVSVTLAD